MKFIKIFEFNCYLLMLCYFFLDMDLLLLYYVHPPKIDVTFKMMGSVEDTLRIDSSFDLKLTNSVVNKFQKFVFFDVELFANLVPEITENYKKAVKKPLYLVICRDYFDFIFWFRNNYRSFYMPILIESYCLCYRMQPGKEFRTFEIFVMQHNLIVVGLPTEDVTKFDNNAIYDLIDRVYYVENRQYMCTRLTDQELKDKEKFLNDLFTKD